MIKWLQDFITDIIRKHLWNLRNVLIRSYLWFWATSFVFKTVSCTWREEGLKQAKHRARESDSNVWWGSWMNLFTCPITGKYKVKNNTFNMKWDSVNWLNLTLCRLILTKLDSHYLSWVATWCLHVIQLADWLILIGQMSVD